MAESADLAGFEDAYRTQATYVAHVLGRLAVPAEAVGDAVQDVFVAAYRRWPDFDRGRPVRPWLTGFARRIAFRYRRADARRRRKRAAWLHVVRDRQRPASHELEARDFLQRFLAQIDAGHRRAFLLMELEGLSAPEAATALGISAEAVYGRVRSTRRRLKQALLIEAREPDPRAAALVPPWAMLRDKLAVGVPAIVAPALGGSAGGALKTFAATIAIGLVGLTAVDLSRGRDVPLDASFPGAPVAVATDEAPPVVVADAQPRSDPTAPARARVDEDDRALVDEAASRSAPRAPLVRTTTTPPAQSAPSGSLAEETVLLRAAKSALTRGDADTALEHLDAHARRFPSGQLADARHRSRIRALCDLGRAAQARGEARKLADARPGDPLARQALSICATPTIQNGPRPEK